MSFAPWWWPAVYFINTLNVIKKQYYSISFPPKRWFLLFSIFQ